MTGQGGRTQAAQEARGGVLGHTTPAGGGNHGPRVLVTYRLIRFPVYKTIYSFAQQVLKP